MSVPSISPGGNASAADDGARRLTMINANWIDGRVHAILALGR